MPISVILLGFLGSNGGEEESVMEATDLSGLRWVVRDNKVFRVCAPIRAGKKHQLAPAGMEFDQKELFLTITIGEEEWKIPITDSRPAQSCERDTWLITTQEFAFVLPGDQEAVWITFQLHYRRTDAFLRREEEERFRRDGGLVGTIVSTEASRKRAEAKRADAEALNRDLELLKAKLVDPGVIRTAAQLLQPSHYNKLWQRESDRLRFAARALMPAIHQSVANANSLISLLRNDCSFEASPFRVELERARLLLWDECQKLHAATKAHWLAENPPTDNS